MIAQPTGPQPLPLHHHCGAPPPPMAVTHRKHLRRLVLAVGQHDGQEQHERLQPTRNPRRQGCEWEEAQAAQGWGGAVRCRAHTHFSALLSSASPGAPRLTSGPHRSQLRSAAACPLNFQFTGISTMRRLRPMVATSRQMVFRIDSSSVYSSGTVLAALVDTGMGVSCGAGCDVLGYCGTSWKSCGPAGGGGRKVEGGQAPRACGQRAARAVQRHTDSPPPGGRAGPPCCLSGAATWC